MTVSLGDVEFIGAIGQPGQPSPTPLPQVAIAGRSNVGKSSLINRLLGRKNLARTSKQPGRTREINFFRVDDRFAIVDLPGYGFARAPDEVRERWGQLMDGYLGTSNALRGIVLLVDIRRGLTADDHRMLDYLAELGTPALVVLTKADKLNRSGRRKARERLAKELQIDQEQMLETSARTGHGVDTLRESIFALIEGDGSAAAGDRA